MGAIKHKEIEIPVENPFENCQLGRARYATVLTEIIGANPSGFVLAVNSEWGTGKSTFVKMWMQHLIGQGYQTLCINAWENDLIADPSVAILGELGKLSNDKNKAFFEDAIKVGATIIKHTLPDLLKAFVKQYVDIDAVAEAVKNTAKASAELLSESVEEYTKKKEGIEDFKKQLEEYLEKGEFKRPVVFIIDELDRCRPDYAVEFLEKIKHFFSVQGIVFVLVLDKEQLGNSIKGFYGSDRINSEEYLRRFIDIEYRLPQPELRNFCEYLYDYFEFDDFFSSKERSGNGEPAELKRIASSLSLKNNLTLRQIEKLFAHSRLVLKSFSSNNYVIPHLFFFLIFLRNHKPDVYKKLHLKVYEYQDLVEEISSIASIIHDCIETEYIVAELLVFYGTYAREIHKEYYNSEKGSLTFSTSTISSEKLIESIKSIDRNPYNGDNVLSHLFSKIELYSNLV